MHTYARRYACTTDSLYMWLHLELTDWLTDYNKLLRERDHPRDVTVLWSWQPPSWSGKKGLCSPLAYCCSLFPLVAAARLYSRFFFMLWFLVCWSFSVGCHSQSASQPVPSLAWSPGISWQKVFLLLHFSPLLFEQDPFTSESIF